MSLKWEYDGKFWRFEPNPPDCEAAIFECRGEFHAIVNGWSPCIRVEEYVNPSTDPDMKEVAARGGTGSMPKGRVWKTLEEAQAYCEQRLRESVMRSALALGIHANPGLTGTSNIGYYCEPMVFQQGEPSI